MEVTLNGYKCETRFSFYQNNQNIALLLKDVTDGELVTIASTNSDFKAPDNVIGIKHWSENEGIVPVLIEAGIIEPGVKFFLPSGYVNIEYYNLTEEALKEVEVVREEMEKSGELIF